MVYELKQTVLADGLFQGWQETLIYSCLQNVMGKIYVTDMSNPVSAFAYVGCFGFLAGEPDRDLAKWEEQVGGKEKPRQKPPEKESIRKRLRELDAESKRQNAERQRTAKKSRDWVC